MNSIKQKTVVIVGGGAAGLMTAMQLSPLFKIVIIEKEKSIGRKLLVAGNGGFNLTNNCTNEALINQYSPSEMLADCLNLFSPKDLQTFLFNLGIETYVGTSGRVFPKQGIKPIEVLEAFKKKLNKNNVLIKLNHQFVSFTNQSIEVLNPQKEIETLAFDYCVFALGGASWSKTGSDGKWTSVFESQAVKVLPFQASNCGLNVDWNTGFLEHHEGKPLKNISFTIANKKVKGEGLITSSGIEGNAIYPLIGAVRNNLEHNHTAVLAIDFKPNNTRAQLLNKMKGRTHKNYSKLLNLSTLEMALLKTYVTKEEFLDLSKFIDKLKNLPIPITGLRPIEEAISTVGGISFTDLKSDFSLKKSPNIYTIGEMVDWDAPTGGFLLQACFSMGNSVANSINERG